MKRPLRIAAALALSAVLGLAAAQESTVQPMTEADTSAGEALYSNCVHCHQSEGQGRAYAYPPLAGHVPDLIAAEGGRAYLINVLLHGIQGEITVEGQPFNGVMPGWSQFSDEDLASLANYLSTAWDNDQALPEDTPAFTAEEVAAEREAGLTVAQVYELRGALELGAE